MMAILVRTGFEDGAITGIKIFLNLNWESLGNLKVIIFIIILSFLQQWKLIIFFKLS